MPQPTEPGYETRMKEAYTFTCANIAAIAEDPESIDASMRTGYMWVQVTGFSGLIRVDGEELNLDKGPKHILAGWPAIVAGRYWQLRDLEEGEYHLHELADINTWIGGSRYEPSYAEMEAGWGDAYAGEQQIPSNLVDPGLFDARAWRALQEARSILAKRITGYQDGELSTNPYAIEEQLNAYKREIAEMSWSLQGKESCYLLWELLLEEHQVALQHTPCIQAMLHEQFEEELGQSPTRGFSGMIASLKAMFSGATTKDPIGSRLTAEYRQGSGETLRAFVERIQLHFSRDLGVGWDQWPHSQRRNLAKRFLTGMIQEDYYHPETPQDVGYLAELNWPELLSRVSRVDQGKQSRTPPQAEKTRGRCDQPLGQADLDQTEGQLQQTVFALQQPPLTPTYQPNFQQQPARDWQPHYQASPPHHAYPTHGNHFVHPTWEQRPPRSRRRRRKRGKGNAPPPSGQGLDYVRSEVSVIKQIMGKMTSNLDALAGCLGAPWGAQGTPTHSSINSIIHQAPPGCPRLPQGEGANGGHSRCTHVTNPPQHLVSTVPTNLSPQPPTQSGRGTRWIEADWSTPGIIRYRFPTNPRVDPSEYAEAQQPELGKPGWSETPPRATPPRWTHDMTSDPVGEAEWEPDAGAFEEDYDHNRGHVANLWNVEAGSGDKLPFAAQFYDTTFQDSHRRGRTAGTATSSRHV